MRLNTQGCRSTAPHWAARTLARLGVLLAALALLSQSLVLAAPMRGGIAEARTAQARLAALLGANVIVCAQSDDPATPAPSDCADACPLCRLAADLAALDAPPAPAFAVPIPLARAAPVATPAPQPPPATPPLHPLPRGPPSKA